jgi:hypothetical protein
LLPPAPVEFAESAVDAAVRVRLPVLFPGQLQRQMAMALELFMKLRKSGAGLRLS